MGLDNCLKILKIIYPIDIRTKNLLLSRFFNGGNMKLKVYRNQTESSGVLRGKKFNYSLKVVAEVSEEEMQLLSKFDYLDWPLLGTAKMIVDAEGGIKGPEPAKITLRQLQKGSEWSSDHLPVPFADIPTSLQSDIENLLGAARFREMWGGEEVIEIK